MSTNLKIGIIGGGQLGKMLNQAASQWHLDTAILDPNPACSAASYTDNFIQGDFTDYQTLYDFGKDKDLLTIEIEKVNVEALRALEKEGKMVFPEPEVLALIQDKGLQKQFYKKHNIPSSSFCIYSDRADVIKAIDSGEIEVPFVQKSRTGGYDGKGVHVVNDLNDLDELMDVPCVIENKVDIDKELAVIVARNTSGEIKSFPVVDMEFNPKANLVEFLFCPASIDKVIEQKAIEMSEACIKAFNMTGILAVELFLDKSGDLFINEVAPRPHNSGHHTIESMVTSQYEQHLRAILDMPLGSTQIHSPAVMINILGEPGFAGKAKFDGLADCMAVEGFKLHNYGKKDTKPFRKMGHATVMDSDIEKAKDKARFIKDKLKVIA